MTTTLTHRIDGDGPPLLLLNGGLMSIAAWDPVVPRLAERFRVVRFDFRGQFLSPGAPNAGMADHADDVAALLDHLDIERAHLVGASFGAVAALYVASRYPDRVASLSCITATDRLTAAMVADSLELRDAADEAARGGDGSRVFDVLAPFTFSTAFLDAHPGFLAERSRVFGMLPSSFFEGLSGLMTALVKLDLSGELPRISSPTLVVGAGLDGIFPPEHSEALARSIQGARLEIIPAVGHAAIVEATDVVFDKVTDFVEPLAMRPEAGAESAINKRGAE